MYGIAESGEPIKYTITKTSEGFEKHGPELPDGIMDSRTYSDTPK